MDHSVSPLAKDVIQASGAGLLGYVVVSPAFRADHLVSTLGEEAIQARGQA